MGRAYGFRRIVPGEDPYLSVIVPTLREAASLAPLTEAVFAALADEPYTTELIIVDDDSQDGTDTVISELSQAYPVRLVVRKGERGLSTAVLRGFTEARGAVLAVMDADGSHPPAVLPGLVAPVRAGQADFVIGSRHVSGGQIDDWPWTRRVTSTVAGSLARGLTPVRDPMSGFFCLRREVWTGCGPLAPLGYKIGLELLVRSHCTRVLEVPITFTDRLAGRSKMTLRTQWAYLRHLARLYAYALTHRG